MSDSSRYDAPQLLVRAARVESRDRPHHGVCLSAPRLTVGEHCSIVALEHGFDQAECALIVDRLLLRLLAVDNVEGEGAGDRVRLAWLKQLDLGCSLIYLHDSCGPCAALERRGRYLDRTPSGSWDAFSP